MSLPEFDAKAAKVMDLYRSLTPSSRSRLVELSDNWVALYDTTLLGDAGYNCTVDFLYAIVTDPVDLSIANVGITADQIASTAMMECNQPGQVDQGSRGTCTVTSMQYVLIRQNPAEYLRIIQGLVQPGDGLVRLAGDASLVRVVDSVPPDLTGRTHTERLFQSALMALARDGYSNMEDPAGGGPGLSASEERNALQALFGGNFEIYVGPILPKGQAGESIVRALEKRGRLNRTFAALDWEDGGHFVFVVNLQNGRVFIRNPWGGHQPAGTQFHNPDRQMEDPEIDLESMTEDLFKENVRHLLWPKE